MLPASNRGVGMNIGFPDVCLTPPVAAPIPYPNFGLNVLAAPFAVNVFLAMMPALNMASKIVMTMGDEPGVMGPWIKMMGAYIMGNPIVMIDGLPGINLLCPTTGNNMNDALGAVLVPSLTNVLFTQRLAPPLEPAQSAPLGRGDPFARTLSAEALRTLGDSPSPVRGEALPDGIGRVVVPLFTFELPTLVYNEIQALSSRGLRALILDLRGNPGGDLDAFVRLAGDFLDEGAIVARVTAADGDESALAAPRGTPYSFPLVVLVDGGTASAAELFAGCLKAHGRAVIVGEVTYGKGAVQRVMPGAGGAGVVYATVARCAPADGEPLDGVGVQPDVTIRRDDAADGHGADDVQLNVARAVALALSAGG